jgi:hypothetical protein
VKSANAEIACRSPFNVFLDGNPIRIVAQRYYSEQHKLFEFSDITFHLTAFNLCTNEMVFNMFL